MLRAGGLEPRTRSNRKKIDVANRARHRHDADLRGGLKASGDAGFTVGAGLVRKPLVVMGLTCVDAGPDGGHVVPPCGGVLVLPTDDVAVDYLRRSSRNS
jgi:hypothetical protein